MKGVYLKFFTEEKRRHHSVLLYEWLLEEAKRIGIPGGSAFRAIAGYGRHGVLHEDHFFELAGDLPVEVSFLLNEKEAEALLTTVREAGLNLFYVRMPADYGITSGGPA